MKRREFLKLTAVGTGALLAGPALSRGQNAPAAAAKKSATMIGIPISIAPLVEMDPDTMFADMVSRAGVNALFPFLYTHEPHRGGRPVEGFHGGNYARSEEHTSELQSQR